MAEPADLPAGGVVPGAPAALRRQARLLGINTRGITAREKWGYGTWLFFGLVFGLPESWAGAANPPWPTLSETIGHLEGLWPGTRVVVVVLISLVVYSVVRYPPGHTGDYPAREGEPGRGRTGNGRLTAAPVAAVNPVPALIYIPVAVAIVALGSLIAAFASSDRFVLGYVLYGLFTIFCVFVPNLAAYWLARDVPFPTFFRTVYDLDHRWRPAAMIIVAWLVVLMFHLALFPWPGLQLSLPARHRRTGSGQPRPMNGIVVAVMVRNCTLASRGRLAM